MATYRKPISPIQPSKSGDVSPEAGIDRDPQSGQAKKDRSLSDEPEDHLPNGAVGSAHEPKAE